MAIPFLGDAAVDVVADIVMMVGVDDLLRDLPFDLLLEPHLPFDLPRDLPFAAGGRSVRLVSVVALSCAVLPPGSSLAPRGGFHASGPTGSKAGREMRR